MAGKSLMDKVDELAFKPSSYKFNKDEIALIKKMKPKSDWKVKYALYRMESKKNCYIGYIIDGMPNSVRKSGVENLWEVICTRELSNLEYQELIENYGTNNRRFQIYLYKDIEALQEEDKIYKVETPEKFVKVCKEKGYSGDIQLKMNLYN